MENELELSRTELKTCISSYKEVIELQKKEIEILQKENEHLKDDLIKLEKSYDKLFDRHEQMQYMYLQLRKEYNSSDINILQIEEKKLLGLLEKANKEIERLQNRIQEQIKYQSDYANENCKLKIDNQRLRNQIQTLESKYNELEKSYKIGCLFKIKECKVFDRALTRNVIEQMFEDWGNKTDTEKGFEIVFNQMLQKLYNSKDGFLYQKFIDYDTLKYCYENFIKHGFEVQQVGSDTLIIRNKK